MKAISRHLPTVARVLLGLIFVVTGLNGFLHFIPNPTEVMPEPLLGFMSGLAGTGYMFPLIMGTQLVAGALLLANRFVPLALAVLAPIIVNIVALHFVIAQSGIPRAVVVLVLELFLAWSYRAAYRPMLAARVHVDGPARVVSSKPSRGLGDHVSA